MITAAPTEHLTGVMLEGSYDDFYEIVDSIHRITELEGDYEDPYWSVENRLLGVCYDIRHAYQGDRHVRSTKDGKRYAVEILFPEALFVAFSVPAMFAIAHTRYGERAQKQLEMIYGESVMQASRYADYPRDRAMLELLCSTILSAFAEVIGDETFEKLMRSRSSQNSNYMFYAAQYVDKCNVEYLKTPHDKRANKLKNIARRLIKAPVAYYNLKRDFEFLAKEYGCSIHELHDPRLEYPEEIEW